MFWQNVHHLDQQISLTINSWNSAFSNPIWAFLSMKLVWAPLYAAILALIIWKLGWKKGGILIVGTILTIVFCDQLSNLIKNLVCRARPMNDAFMLENGLNILEGPTRSFSFFSAHAANSFGLVGCTWLGLKKGLADSTNPTDTKIVKWYGWFMFIWAALVAISRIFVGKHYLGDVIVGTIAGLIIGLTLGHIVSIINRKFLA